MTTTLRQKSFAGGEIAPNVQGRDDLTRYLASVHTCRGFIVTRHGALVNRPGTRYVAETKDSARKSRLIPFNFSDGQNFVLEFGHQYVRFHQNGGQVQLAGDLVPSGFDADGAPLYSNRAWNVFDPYVVGDVVEFNGKVYRALLNGSNHNPEALPTYWLLLGNVGDPLEIATTYTEMELARIKYAQVGDVVTLVHPNHAPAELRRRGNYTWTLADIDFARKPHGISEVTIDYPRNKALMVKPRTINFCVTVLMEDAAGILYESAPYYLGGNARTLDTTEASDWDAGLTYVQDATVIGSNLKVYRSLLAANTNHDPTVSPTWWEEFKPADGWSLSLLEHSPVIELYVPKVPGYTAKAARLYQGRGSAFGYVDEAALTTDAGSTGLKTVASLGFTPTVSFTVDGTISPDFNQPPPAGSNPFATDFPSCVGFFEQRRIFANTVAKPNTIFISVAGDFYDFDRRQFVVAAGATDFRLANTAFEEARWIASLDNLLIGTNVHTPWSIGGIQGAPLAANSISARPKNRYASSWLDPIIIGTSVLAVQEMGNLVCEVTYDYKIDGYESTDLSIMAEHLTDHNSIVDWAYAQSPFSVVWGVRDDGVLLGLTRLRDQEVSAWHWHDTQGAFESLCAVREGTEHAVYVIVNRSLGDGTHRRYVERFASRKLPRLQNGDVDVTRGVFLDASLTYDGAPATTFSNLAHLEGLTVGILADGAELAPRPVVGGSVDISDEMPDGASVVTIGLSYVSDVESLDAVVQGDDGKRYVYKRVVGAEIDLVDSRGGKAGASFDELVDLRYRRANETSVAQFVTSRLRIHVASNYNSFGRVCVRQDSPLPMMITGLVREVDFGD